MTFYDAFAAAEPAVHWKGELGVRIRDILDRRVGGRVDALARLVERGIEHSLPVERIKGSLVALISALRRRGAAVEVDAGVDGEIEELTLLFERVVGHGEGRQIESYSMYLFTVDTEVRL